MKAPTSLLAVLLMLSSTSLAQTPPAEPTAPTQQAVAAASADAVPAASLAPLFAPGAKIFLEPMNGFEEFLSEAIVKKKVPVVVVKERAKADFVMSGEAHVKKPGWKGIVLDTRGKGNVSVKDARSGNVVFACKFNKVDQGLGEYWIYQGWANGCARHLKKAMEKK